MSNMPSVPDQQPRALDALTYEVLQTPNYVHKTVAATIGGVNMTVSDIEQAAVLAGLKVLKVGHSEKGKTFSAEEFSAYWFGGRSNLVQAASLDENSELFTLVFKQPDRDEGKMVINYEKLSFPLMVVEEIGAIPKPLKAQAYPIGDGYIPHEGEHHFLGVPLPWDPGKRYFVIIATTNTLREEDNGGYGNFGLTKAEVSRYDVCIDLRGDLRRNNVSLLEILMQNATSRTYGSRRDVRDLTELLLGAYKKIIETSAHPSLEEQIALAFIGLGSGKCKKGDRHEDGWQQLCMNCGEQAACPAKFFFAYEMMRADVATKVFANALAYLAKLKDPTVAVSTDVTYDAVFQAARFTLPHRMGVINELWKREKKLSLSAFSRQGIDALQNHFNNDVKPYVNLAIECMTKYGVVPTQFLMTGTSGSTGAKLYPLELRFFEGVVKSKKVKDKTAQQLMDGMSSQGTAVEPFTNTGFVDTSWIPDLLRMHGRKEGLIKDE